MKIEGTDGDKIEIEAVDRWTVRLKYCTADGAKGRGDLLAESLRGRLALEPRAWYLTPARLERWIALYRGGWTARRIQVRGAVIWVYDRGGLRAISITEATKRSNREAKINAEVEQ